MPGRFNFSQALSTALERQRQEANTERQLSTQETQVANEHSHQMVQEELARQSADLAKTNADRSFEQEKQQTANTNRTATAAEQEAQLRRDTYNQTYRPIALSSQPKALHGYLTPDKDGNVTQTQVDQAWTNHFKEVDDTNKALQNQLMRRSLTAADVADHKEKLAEAGLRVEGHVSKLIAGMNVLPAETEDGTGVFGIKGHDIGSLGANIARGIIDPNWMKGNSLLLDVDVRELENLKRMTNYYLPNMRQLVDVVNSSRDQGIPLTEGTKGAIALGLQDILTYQGSDAMHDPRSQETFKLAGQLSREMKGSRYEKMMSAFDNTARDSNRIDETAAAKKK